MTRVRRTIIGAACLASLLTLALACNAEDKETKITLKDIPAAVLSAFHKSYPKAEIKGVAKETEKGGTYFEIESVDEGISRDLLYLADGTVAEIEEAVDPANLPAPVKAAVANKYPKGKIVKAEKTMRDALTTYDLRIVSGKMNVNLVVTPDGKLISVKESGDEHKEVPDAEDEN
jgi:hypothetical protein